MRRARGLATHEPEQDGLRGVRVLLWLLALVTLGVMGLSYMQPLSADDYGSLLKISQTAGFLDFVKSYYLTWTGRATGVSIIRFALVARASFAVLNGLAFTSLAYLTVLLGLGRRPSRSRKDVLLVAIVLATYWFALPVVSETVFWVTGSATYLWSALLMLLFSAPYRLWIDENQRPPALRRVLAGIGLVLLGIACGLTHELVVAALAVLLTAFVLSSWKSGRIRQVPLELWVGVPALATGAALMLVSPGNGARAQTGSAGDGLSSSAVAFVLYMGKAFGSYLPQLYPWLLLILVAAVPVSVLAARRLPALSLGPWLAWVAAGLATLVPFVLEPQIGLMAGARTTMYAAVLFTVCAVSMHEAEMGDRVLDALPAALSVTAVAVLLCVVVVELAGSLQVARSIRAQVRERELLIAEAVAGGQRDVAVAPLAQKPYRTVYYVDIGTNPEYWLNRSVAAHYGAESIRLAP